MKMTYCGSCKALHRMAAEKLERDAKHQQGSNIPEENWENGRTLPSVSQKLSLDRMILKFHQDKSPEISTRTHLPKKENIGGVPRIDCILVTLIQVRGYVLNHTSLNQVESRGGGGCRVSTNPLTLRISYRKDSFLSSKYISKRRYSITEDQCSP